MKEWNSKSANGKSKAGRVAQGFPLRGIPRRREAGARVRCGGNVRDRHFASRYGGVRFGAVRSDRHHDPASRRLRAITLRKTGMLAHASSALQPRARLRPSPRFFRRARGRSGNSISHVGNFFLSCSALVRTGGFAIPYLLDCGGVSCAGLNHGFGLYGTGSAVCRAKPFSPGQAIRWRGSSAQAVGKSRASSIDMSKATIHYGATSPTSLPNAHGDEWS